MNTAQTQPQIKPGDHIVVNWLGSPTMAVIVKTGKDVIAANPQRREEWQHLRWDDNYAQWSVV